MTHVPPSQEGFHEAERQVSLFTDELLAESSRIARRNQAEQASVAHVRAAAQHLYANGSSRVSQALFGIGSLIAGASASAFASFILATPVKTGAAIGMVVALVAGIVLAAVGLVRR